MFRKLTVAILVMLFCLNAFAFTVDVPGKVILEEDAEEIIVNVENDSVFEKDLKVEFYAPVDYEIKGLAGSAPAEGTETFKIELQPSEELADASYTATLIVYLDGEKQTEQIDLELKEAGGEVPVTGFVPMLTPQVTGEIILDVVLAIIAAILLVAFISRLAKRWS